MKTSMKLTQSGSITIPKSVRMKLGWKRGMSLDIAETTDGALLIRKHCACCRFCGTAQDLRQYEDLCVCVSCAEKMKEALS